MMLSDYFYYVSFVTSLAALVAYGLSQWRLWPKAFGPAIIMTWINLLVLVAFFVLKYIELQYPPFRTLFQSLVFLALTISLIYVIFEFFYRMAILGFLSHLFILLVLLYSWFKMGTGSSQLPAALQSVWFIPHVVIYFFGYAALFLAAALAVIYLLYSDKTFELITARGKASVSLNGIMHFMSIIGFVFISLGLVIGAIWAKEAWGDYWAWDPKENWSLITFLLYSVYFHLRRRKGLEQRALAKLLIVGFAAVMFTYLGMSLLPTAQQSEHVYIENKMR